MLGAIAGDIIGSIYETRPIKTPHFYPLFDPLCHPTDDSVLTIAQADSILHGRDFVVLLKEYYHRYPNAGYGGNFSRWARATVCRPYNSWGNGSAMRVSPIGFAYNTLDMVLEKAKESAAATHNHPEGIKGAQATASAIFLARSGKSKDEIKTYIVDLFGYDLSRSLDEIRPDYRFDVSCQGTVPQAIQSFLESTDYEHAVRLAISLGGDSDTLACITGGIADAYYGGVPDDIAEQVWEHMDDHLAGIVREFLIRHP